MKIAISGASGFVGTNLKKFFEKEGDTIISLNRSLFDDSSISKLKEALTGVDVVINLAGASINHRWTESYKQKMRDSRINTTKKIVEVINSLDVKPSLFISTSAVGYYPNFGCYDELSSVKGNGFLSDLCEEWEKEASKVSSDVRLVITRFGVIIAEEGGAFPKMTLSMRFKLATIIGPGTQHFSWIYIQDLLHAMKHITSHPAIYGVVNLVAPEQITNRDFTKAISRYNKCLLSVTIPRLFFNLVLGEASSFMTEGQCIIPQRLLDSGFSFCAPSTEELAKKLYDK